MSSGHGTCHAGVVSHLWGRPCSLHTPGRIAGVHTAASAAAACFRRAAAGADWPHAATCTHTHTHTPHIHIMYIYKHQKCSVFFAFKSSVSLKYHHSLIYQVSKGVVMADCVTCCCARGCSASPDVAAESADPVHSCASESSSAPPSTAPPPAPPVSAAPSQTAPPPATAPPPRCCLQDK